jgi:hypothetical protein
MGLESYKKKAFVSSSAGTDAIPKNATIRQEFIKCGNPDCVKKHRPYLYAYWKDNKRLRKKYVGKSWDDYYDKLSTRKVNMITGKEITSIQFKKLKFLENQAETKGDKLALEYIEKLDRKQNRSIDWTYKQVVNHVREYRMLKMVRIAHKRNFEYNGPDELFNFIVSDIQSKGLDTSNIESIDSYLNSEFM